MASKLCDSCKSATAALFCRPDSAFLCINCDCRIHAANNKLLPSRRHARVWLCEVCEQAPAHVTCKADAAALCVACDRDIHSANPLSRRHDRVPVVPFYDAVPSSSAPLNFLDDRYFAAAADVDDVSSEEAEAASWLLPNPSAAAAAGGNNKESPDLNAGQFIFPEMDNPYLDLDYGPVDPKMEAQEQNSSGTDGVVPVQCDGGGGGVLHHQPPLMNDHCFDLDFSAAAAGGSFSYGYNAQLSSSSMEVGVVPDDGSAMADPYGRGGGGMSGGAESAAATPLSAVDREARVMRYREKRKNRKFEKTIRYASRKAYAETRPRIKGRFAKRTETEVEADRCMYGFGVVPSF